MWYSVLLTGNTSKEYSLFLENFRNAEEFEVSLEHFERFRWGRMKWERLFNEFKNINSHSSLFKYNFINLEIVVQYKFLGIIEDDKLRILINETNENIYIDKYFERDYKKLFLKFKNILLSLYSSSKDIVYTENAGKNSFFQFEKPKFKSISERKEYVNSLLDILIE